MSITVYHGEPNGPSFTVLAALFETGIDAALVHIDLAKGGRHSLACAQQPEVAMSVEGEGPVVVVDGEGMTDSVFIACYFDDLGKSNSLRPSDPFARWEMMTWCRQLIERTAPAAAYLGISAHAQAATLRCWRKSAVWICAPDGRTQWPVSMRRIGWPTVGRRSRRPWIRSRRGSKGANG